MLIRTLSALATAVAVGGTCFFTAGASAQELRDREEIAPAYKWDFTLIYPSWEAWEADLEALQELIPELVALKGTLTEGPDQLLRLMRKQDELGKYTSKLFAYTGLQRDVDQRQEEPQAQFRRLLNVYYGIRNQLSWVAPELLSIGEDRVLSWIEENPELEDYRHELVDLYRQQDHVLDERGEELLAYFAPLKGAPGLIYEAITTADAKYPEVVLADGETYQVTSGSYGRALNTFRNQEDRQKVQQAHMNKYLDQKNTFAAIYDGILKQGWSSAQARNYESVLQSELHEDNVPPEVFHTLVETAREGSDVLQRYHRLRKDWLGLEEYGWADFFVPLVDDEGDYSFDLVKDIVLESVQPLGEEYETKMAEQLSEGRIDVFENPGKRSGAYSRGVYGVGSFVLLNHQGTMDNAFTVAHEMGHSMHSRLSMEYQPYTTHRYTIFVAEVASIFNEKLFLRELLERYDDPKRRVAFIEKQIQDIGGTFYLQTMMADYESRAHALAESGRPVTADRLTQVWSETVADYFGDLIPADDPYLVSWARIPHLFNSPYYVYKYATCYASAATLMKEYENAESPEAKQAVVDRLLGLLKAGGSDYPMNQLKTAGIDLSDPATVQSVVNELERLVDQLEVEYNRLREQRQI